MTKHGKPFFLVIAFALSWIVFAITYLIILLVKAVLIPPVQPPSLLVKLITTTSALFLSLLAFVVAARVLRQTLFFSGKKAALVPPKENLMSHSLGILKRIQEVHLLELRTETSDLVGKIMEAYKASSALLYLYEKNSETLEVFLALNAQAAPSTLHLSKSSVVTLVAKNEYGYCSNNIKIDKNVLPTDGRGRSAIAVPIKLNGRLLGVLYLEAVHQTHNFVAEQIPELEKQSLRLAPALLLFGSYEPYNFALVPLSATTHARGLSSILGPLCTGACDYFERMFHLRPSCTIWEFESDKASFHARATSGFDYEYRNVRTLPKLSFTGDVFNDEQMRVFVEDDIEKIPNFVRRDKAIIMGLKKLVSTQIRCPKSGAPYGVVSLYFFGSFQGVDTTDVKNFSNLIGKIIERYNGLISDVVEAYVRGLIVNADVPSNAKFEVLREAAQDILKSEYCSVFALDNNGRSLWCASTTGLMRGRHLVDIHKEFAGYSLENAANGFTLRVAKKPGTALRKNESQNESEPVLGGKTIMPSNHLVEAHAYGRDDHRRILIASGSDGDALLGVIRLNRSGARAPFVKSDEAILLAIIRGGREIFKNALTYQYFASLSYRRLVQPGDLVRIFANLLEFVPDPATTIDSFLQEVFNRLLSDSEHLHGQHFHLLLQRVIFDRGEESLETYFKLSTRTKLLYANEVVKRSEGGIAWTCINKNRPISFLRDNVGDRFGEVHEYSANVKSGIYVPFSTWNFKSGELEKKWVLCLDFEFLSENIGEYIRVLLLIIRKLQQLLTVDSFPMAFFPTETIEQFVDRVGDGLTRYQRSNAHFNMIHGSPYEIVKENPPRSERGEIHPRTVSVDFQVTCMSAGGITIWGVPADEIESCIKTVKDSWYVSGLSNPSPNAYWVFNLDNPTEEEGLIIWPNQAAWSGPIRDPDAVLN